jgi:hypothetical protein
MDTARVVRWRLFRGSFFVVVGALSISLGQLPTNFDGHSAFAAAGAASVPVCSPRSLEVMVVFNGPGNPYGAITFDSTAGTPCLLSGRPLIRVVTKSGKFLDLHESTERLTPAMPRPTGPTTLTAKAPWAVVEMKWCGFKSTYNHLTIRFRGWSQSLKERNPPFSRTSFDPPACSNTTASMLGVDYVRALENGTVAGSTQTMHVTPSGNLHSGEKVRVSVTGFGLDTKFWLAECVSSAEVSKDGCGEQLAAQPFGETNMDGAGSYTFTVRDTALSAPYRAGVLRRCTDQCVLVTDDGLNLFETRLTFGPG